MRRVLVALLILAIAALAYAFANRRMLVLQAVGAFVTPPALTDPVDEGPDVRWHDDYYTVEWIDPATVAIGEPRYYQGNYNYLLLGSELAVLFDSGPGVRDIRPLVESLTDLPILAIPSHLHYDHLGSHAEYDRVGLIDLPYLREQVESGRFVPTHEQHLGFAEGVTIEPLPVTDWLAPESTLDLGGRILRVIHTPGHSFDSMSLWDEERKLLFSGDYLNEGILIAFVPGSSLGDYLRTAEALVPRIDGDATILGAHRMTPPGAPRQRHRDLTDLRDLLLHIRDGEAEGEGFFPRRFRVNADLEIWTDFAWSEDFDS